MHLRLLHLVLRTDIRFSSLLLFHMLPRVPGPWKLPSSNFTHLAILILCHTTTVLRIEDLVSTDDSIRAVRSLPPNNILRLLQNLFPYECLELEVDVLLKFLHNQMGHLLEADCHLEVDVLIV